MTELNNNDLIICNDFYKKTILRNLSSEKKLINLKFMTKRELINTLFGTYDEKAIYYLINKYNYKYEIAKMYLDNFNFIDSLKEELEQNNLVIKEELHNISRIISYEELDPFIINKLNDYQIINVTEVKNNYKHDVYEFNDIEDEVNYVCIKILELLKNSDMNKIKLVNVGSEYEFVIKKLFKFYNIPINLNEKKYINGTKEVKEFLNNLKVSKNISEALENIEHNDIYNCIIDVVNKYLFKNIDDVIIYCIEQELKNKKISKDKIKFAINVVDITSINNDDYYFILGFNQGSLPFIYKDEEFLSDLNRKKVGIFTSFEKNLKEKNLIKSKLSNYKNIYLSYKLKTHYDTYYRSSLIDELNLNIVKSNNENYSNSNIYNKIILSKKLDKLIKYNEKDKDLDLLYSNYKNIAYLTYDNKYTYINKNLFLKYIGNKLLLSYSSIDNYYRCGFKYYIKNILKLDKYEETFMTYIGNLFHYILSVAFIPNFNFETAFNDYIKDKEFNNKEKFFIDKLKDDLVFTIETIKKQDEDTLLNKALYEQKIYVNKDKSIKISFMGIIDKLKYNEFDGQNIVAIIDYKTGNPSINLNNTIYGIEMQLPIYLYLASNSKLKNVKVAGFYLQKIIHNNINYQENKNYLEEKSKLYKLEGFSNSDEEILSKLDKNYIDSNVIKGMKVSSKGFYQYTKVIDEKCIDKLINIVDEKIDRATKDILDAEFSINPKKIGQKLLGCEFCGFNDICYKKEEDVVNLKEQKYEDFLVGDDNA